MVVSMATVVSSGSKHFPTRKYGGKGRTTSPLRPDHLYRAADAARRTRLLSRRFSGFKGHTKSNRKGKGVTENKTVRLKEREKLARLSSFPTTGSRCGRG